MTDKESRGNSHFSVGKSANDQQRMKGAYQSHGIIFSVLVTFNCCNFLQCCFFNCTESGIATPNTVTNTEYQKRPTPNWAGLFGSEEEEEEEYPKPVPEKKRIRLF
jgi:hypothetical protein